MARSPKQNESVDVIADIFSQNKAFTPEDISKFFGISWVLTLSVLVMRKFFYLIIHKTTLYVFPFFVPIRWKTLCGQRTLLSQVLQKRAKINVREHYVNEHTQYRPVMRSRYDTPVSWYNICAAVHFRNSCEIRLICVLRGLASHSQFTLRE